MKKLIQAIIWMVMSALMMTACSGIQVAEVKGIWKYVEPTNNLEVYMVFGENKECDYYLYSSDINDMVRILNTEYEVNGQYIELYLPNQDITFTIEDLNEETLSISNEDEDTFEFTRISNNKFEEIKSSADTFDFDIISQEGNYEKWTEFYQYLNMYSQDSYINDDQSAAQQAEWAAQQAQQAAELSNQMTQQQLQQMMP